MPYAIRAKLETATTAIDTNSDMQPFWASFRNLFATVTVLTVLSGAILIPFKLSTLEKVRQLGERNKLLNKIGTNGEELPPFTVRTPLFNLRIEVRSPIS